MIHDTQTINKTRQDLTNYQEIWLFGYGSLIYKVDFPYIAKAEAAIQGWERRFWQGSHDHRGTIENPGRVLTLIPSQNQNCSGVAYQVSHEVFEHLDHREKNGYLRYEIDINLPNNQIKRGLVYIAPEGNEAYLGPASEKDIAKHIINSKGPSGENKDYVLNLANALRKLNIIDEHTFKIEKYILNIIQS
ncbi:gamma-glutamylcyclotransferase [Aliikangiella sp. IMCC44359]|uniref:gamma-glutamylcyclotransferase n=1 Tax=Aliikangiella sp. IMCC44359 TaxID=3459125 RepID=UPI00403AB1DD